MIILSVGMPRAGSGWHYNLVHDVVVASGGQDARAIRKRFLLSPVLTEVNCNIGALTAKRLIPVMVPSLLGNTFAIKAHSGPTPFAERLMANDQLRVTYIYRDPRAALLSAYEYGQRGLAEGRMTAFGHLETLDQAIDFMAGYVEIWRAWTARNDVLSVRYEDMLAEYDWETPRLLRHLAIPDGMPAVDAVLAQYRPGGAQAQQKGTHFVHGQPERFRKVLNTPTLRRCEEQFGGVLGEMGYEV